MTVLHGINVVVKVSDFPINFNAVVRVDPHFLFQDVQLDHILVGQIIHQI